MYDLPLLNTAGAEIKYLGKQQEVIAQNVANADTPGYQPKQLTPVDFGAFLGKSGVSNALEMARTTNGHMVPGGATPGSNKEQSQKATYEVAPAGNAVILEEQMVKASDTRMNYDLMINLYNKNLSMLRVALGVAR